MNFDDIYKRPFESADKIRFKYYLVVIGKFRFRFRFRPKYSFEPKPKFGFIFLFRFKPKPKFRFNLMPKTEINMTSLRSKISTWKKENLQKSFIFL